MLVIAQSAIRKQESLLLDIPQAAEFFRAWGIEGEVRAEESALSLRFAIGKHGQDTVLVLGVRREGRGFDIGIPKTDWDCFVPAPDEIVLRWGEGESGGQAGLMSAVFPDEEFESFLESISRQAQEFPERLAIVEVAQYYFPEDDK